VSPSPDGALSACAALRHPAPPRRRPPPRRLLLEELLAHTEPGHPDEADLREALARIREVPPSHADEEMRRATPHQASVLNPAAQVAAFINEETRVSATLCKLREIARRFAQPEAREDATRGGGRAPAAHA